MYYWPNSILYLLERISNRSYEKLFLKISIEESPIFPGLGAESQSTSAFCRQFRRDLGAVTPQKSSKGPDPKEQSLTAEQDLSVTLRAGVSFNQREQLKMQMLNYNIDCWAATGAMKKMKEELTSIGEFKWAGEPDWRTMICTNVRNVLHRRVQTAAKYGDFQKLFCDFLPILF